VLAKRGFQGHGLASGPNYMEADILRFLKDKTAETQHVVNVMNAD
jgi:hypothetical protein